MTTTGPVAPISNELAERLIIGRILVDPEAIGKVMPTLLPEAITNENRREIYRTALILQCQNTAPTVEAVSAWLMDLLSDEMKATLQDCQKAVCNRWAQRVRNGEMLFPAVRLVMTKHLRRIAASMGEKLIEMANDYSLSPEGLCQNANWIVEKLWILLPSCVEQGDDRDVTAADFNRIVRGRIETIAAELKWLEAKGWIQKILLQSDA